MGQAATFVFFFTPAMQRRLIDIESRSCSYFTPFAARPLAVIQTLTSNLRFESQYD